MGKLFESPYAGVALRGGSNGEPTIAELVVVGDVVYFTAPDSDYPESELWRSDGTAANTALVLEINPTGGANPESLLVHLGLLFFTASDGVNGTELWYSDGTDGRGGGYGTALAFDLNDSGNGVSAFGEHAGRLALAGDDGATGSEPWLSDGTAAGTTQLADLNPGAAASEPADFLSWGDRLLFTAFDAAGDQDLSVLNPGSTIFATGFESGNTIPWSLAAE